MKIKLLMLFLVGFVNAQQKAIKPKIMIVPSNVWMNSNNFYTEIEVQGETLKTYNYLEAFSTDPTLKEVVNTVGGIFAERGFEFQDMLSAIESINKKNQRNNATGKVLSVLDELANEVSADIRMELDYNISDVGFGQKQVDRFSMTAFDTYTSNNVANAGQAGSPSSQTSISLLMRERVLAFINNLESDILGVFQGYLQNGREIKIELVGSSNAIDMGCWDLYSDFKDGLMFYEYLDDWAVKNGFNGTGRAEPLEESVEIILNVPIVDENGRATNAFRTALHLLKELNNDFVLRPENRGLGYAVINLNDCK